MAIKECPVRVHGDIEDRDKAGREPDRVNYLLLLLFALVAWQCAILSELVHHQCDAVKLEADERGNVVKYHVGDAPDDSSPVEAALIVCVLPKIKEIEHYTQSH